MQKTLQDEAEDALDMADKATLALEEERVQLTQQNSELQQQLAALRYNLAGESPVDRPLTGVSVLLQNCGAPRHRV